MKAAAAVQQPVNGAVWLVLLALVVFAYLAARNSSRACNADPSRLTVRETRTQVLHPERLCMMKRCGNEFTHSVHGWKTCDEHTFGVKA